MIFKEIDEKAEKWLKENEPQIVAEWMHFVEIASVRSAAEPHAPFGKKCAEALSAGAKLYQQHGFSVREEPDRGYALASFGEQAQTVGLFTHTDVVPVGDGWVMTEPFRPLLKDGAIIGRGVNDNKSGVMAALCVMRMLREFDIPMHSRVLTFLGSNEESGMGDITAFVKNERMPEVSLVPDGGFPYSLGERGIYRFWAISDAPMQNVLSFSGGDAFNTVLDFATVTLCKSEALQAELTQKISGRTEFALSVQPETLTLTAKGLAKHAGSPRGGINAAHLAAQVLSECENLPDSDRKVLAQTAFFLSDMFGATLKVAGTDSIFGETTTVNGMVKMTENRLALSFDVRYGTEFPSETIEERLSEAFCEQSWAILPESKFNRPGFRIPETHPLALRLTEAFSEMTQAEAHPIYMTGGTYARYLKNAFSVGTAARTPETPEPKLSLPPEHGGAHQADEIAHIPQFFAAVRILLQYVLCCDRYLTEQA